VTDKASYYCHIETTEKPLKRGHFWSTGGAGQMGVGVWHLIICRSAFEVSVFRGKHT